MKWSKLGKVFDPTQHALPNNCFSFAQSPQTLVLDDRVRIYFSTRERDSIGKYLSHVAFVDFDLSLTSVIGVSKTTVVELGKLGCFDEHGIFPVNIMRDESRVLAYTTGWNRKVSVSADASIGLAISHDNGLTFEKYGDGPIMAATLNEPFLVGDAFVASYGNIFHMWYIFGMRWIKFTESESPDRVYKIAHALSEDGVNWRRNGQAIIPDKLNADECQALPTVFQRNGAYHMYFCYRQAHGFRRESNSAYRLGYAYSTDLINWVRNDALAGIDVSEAGWDSQMQCYPHTFELEGKIFMLYNGNEFGRHGFGLAVLND
jgi:sucrose-6-phosphate hydrolase SacC (GH32 family)